MRAPREPFGRASGGSVCEALTSRVCQTLFVTPWLTSKAKVNLRDEIRPPLRLLIHVG